MCNNNCVRIKRSTYYLTLLVWGPTLDVRIWHLETHQNLTPKVDPHAEVKHFVMAVDP